MRQFVVVGAQAVEAPGASCPDGWSKVEVKDSVECVYFGGLKEGVTKADAEVLCAAWGGVTWWTWMSPEVPPRITPSRLSSQMWCPASPAGLGCSGTDSGGLEPPVWDLTVNTTGETGGGTLQAQRWSGLIG